MTAGIVPSLYYSRCSDWRAGPLSLGQRFAVRYLQAFFVFTVFSAVTNVAVLQVAQGAAALSSSAEETIREEESEARGYQRPNAR